jgi:hypothetical protein
MHRKPGKIRSIHEAERSLKFMKAYIKRDNFFKGIKPPLVDKLNFMSCQKPKFIEKKIIFKHGIIDLAKLASRLEQEGIAFKNDPFELKIGEHIAITENSLLIGVDAYPELMRIVSECLVEPRELASLIKLAAA